MVILTETGISPGIIFTDSDPSMIQSIKEIYPNTKHLLCIFHINLNLQKKLKGKLGNKFEEFRHKFYTCRNSLCEDLFELRWNQLINQYPVAAKYLSDTLYINKESWAYIKDLLLGHKVHRELNQSTDIYMIKLIKPLHYVIYYLVSKIMLEMKNILKILNLNEMPYPQLVC